MENLYHMEDSRGSPKITSNRYLEMRFAGLIYTESILYMALLDIHEDGNEWPTIKEFMPWAKSFVSNHYETLRRLEEKGIVVSSETKPRVFHALSMYSAEFQALTRKYREERLEQMIETSVVTIVHSKGMKREKPQ